MKVEISRNPRVKDRVVIHAHDCWSVDYTLAKIIGPLLKQLKKQTKNPCNAFYEDGYQDLEGEAWERACEEALRKFHRVLDAIIWAMEQIARGGWNEPTAPIPIEQKHLSRTQRNKRNWEVIEWGRGWCRTRMHSELADTIDAQEEEKFRKDQKEYRDRVKEGCRLLGEYFQNLWD